MANRFNDLEDYVHDSIESALGKTYPDVYEDLMPVLNTSGTRLKKYFVRVLVDQFDRSIAAELRAHHIPQKLVELQAAEDHARVRQRRWLEDPGAVDPSERPVILPRLSTRELVDCELREARMKWLAELNARLVETRRTNAELASSIEQQRSSAQHRLDSIHERLQELERARDALNGAPAGIPAGIPGANTMVPGSNHGPPPSSPPGSST